MHEKSQAMLMTMVIINLLIFLIQMALKNLILAIH